LKPIVGHEEAFTVEMGWGDVVELSPETDGGIIERNDVAITYLSRLTHDDRPDLESISKSLDGLLG
jgi:5'-nucleotidase